MKEDQEFDEIFAQDQKKPKGLRNIIIGIIVIIVIIIAVVALWPKTEVSKHDVKEDVVAEKDISQASKDPNDELDKIIQDIKKAHDAAKDVDKKVEEIKEPSLAQGDAPVIIAKNEPQGEYSTQKQTKEKEKTADKSKKAPVKKATAPVRKIDSKKIADLKVQNGSVAPKGSYLQLGVFSQTPSREFIRNIGKHPYRTLKVEINSQELTKYLVGPFDNRREANAYKKDRGLKNAVYFEVK
ncbi:MAG: hypothetical protein E7K04_02425 [Helicobacter sp.]|nr:hypothetical protein [Helicobacter sp.]